ncbi:winged helix-turn-helix transcriptional regulator [Sphingomonas canadensis]|uniref:Winged helix-turn-helix transcriptional regulator n=1 Tax=Sphingomonas canadensis TaxID=1219257 RepID=A0ABW3H005_9SPHN|nr:winged helix-turn-helix transcriptional regulator [Sphingomonas canadensis]MCW3835325.1 winged helix-turn-helix transcriptional regulator [Sphingomonas canadensis]
MSTPLDNDTLRKLTASRWAMPVLALIARAGGARFAVIAHRFGLSPHSLTRCLQHLRDCGWVMPNPGHGHPLRPEYVPSAAGLAVGAACERILAARERLGLGTADLPRWGLPVAAGLDAEWTRFGTLQSRLSPVTPRALSTTLKAMIGHDLVRRRLEDRYPPMPLYGLTGRGQDLAGAVLG